MSEGQVAPPPWKRHSDILRKLFDLAEERHPDGLGTRPEFIALAIEHFHPNMGADLGRKRKKNLGDWYDDEARRRSGNALPVVSARVLSPPKAIPAEDESSSLREPEGLARPTPTDSEPASPPKPVGMTHIPVGESFPEDNRNLEELLKAIQEGEISFNRNGELRRPWPRRRE